MHSLRFFVGIITILLLAAPLRSQASIAVFTSTLTVTNLDEAPADSATITVGDLYLLVLSIDDSVLDSDPATSETYFSNALVGASLSRISSNTGLWDPGALTLSTPASIDLHQITPDTADLDLTYRITGDPSRGTVTVDQNGTYTYTPTDEARRNAAAAAIGDRGDTFTVTVADGDTPFRVSMIGTPLATVPEPSVGHLFALGGLTALLLRRRGGHGVSS